MEKSYFSYLDIESALEEKKELHCAFKTTNEIEGNGKIVQAVGEYNFLIKEDGTDLAYIIYWKNIKHIEDIENGDYPWSHEK